MQLAVYKFHELVGSSLIASTPFPEKAGYCVRIFRHIHRQSLRELFFATAALIKWGEDLNGQSNAFRAELSYLIIRPKARFYDAGTPA
jgi:hypothetical protein